MDADISGIRKVSVHLKSIIDGEVSELVFPGEYQMRNGSHCVVYTDYSGNDITKVGIEASEKAMLLHRVGFITADMLFDPELDVVVNYVALSLQNEFILHADEYHIVQGGGALLINTAYTLNDDSGEPPIRGAQEITITFPEAKNS